MTTPVLTEEMTVVRCRSCRRKLGIAPADFRIYCDEMCASDYVAAAAEARDALIEAIFQDVGLSKTSLAKDFGVSRQRVEQIISLRSYR